VVRRRARAAVVVWAARSAEVRAGVWACGRAQVPAGDPAPVVIPIPESAAHATLGFYEESVRMGRPCTVDLGFFRNPYVGRSFISPSQELRDLKVLCKFNPM
jgi:glutamine phosphoribosylpyrophosphate amidotransferase